MVYNSMAKRQSRPKAQPADHADIGTALLDGWFRTGRSNSIALLLDCPLFAHTMRLAMPF